MRSPKRRASSRSRYRCWASGVVKRTRSRSARTFSVTICAVLMVPVYPFLAELCTGQPARLVKVWSSSWSIISSSKRKLMESVSDPTSSWVHTVMPSIGLTSSSRSASLSFPTVSSISAMSFALAA